MEAVPHLFPGHVKEIDIAPGAKAESFIELLRRQFKDVGEIT